MAAPAALRAALGPRYGGQLRVGLLELPARADPAAPAGPAEALLQSLVHETLVGLGPEGLPTPGLAQRWSSAAGGREWTLFLGAGLRFHDDRPVAAEDAVRSLRRFLRTRSLAAERLAESLEGGEDFRARRRDELAGLAAPETDRVVLRLTAPRALPLAPLASPAAAVVSSSGAGAGPFVPTLLVPGRRAALNAFAGHVRGRPYLDELELQVEPLRKQAETARFVTSVCTGRLSKLRHAILSSYMGFSLHHDSSRRLVKDAHLQIDDTFKPCRHSRIMGEVASWGAHQCLVWSRNRVRSGWSTFVDHLVKLCPQRFSQRDRSSGL